jgi:hypothetical protein
MRGTRVTRLMFAALLVVDVVALVALWRSL